MLRLLPGAEAPLQFRGLGQLKGSDGNGWADSRAGEAGSGQPGSSTFKFNMPRVCRESHNGRGIDPYWPRLCSGGAILSRRMIESQCWFR